MTERDARIVEHMRWMAQEARNLAELIKDWSPIARFSHCKTCGKYTDTLSCQCADCWDYAASLAEKGARDGK